LLRYGVAAVASIAVTLGLKLLFDPFTGQSTLSCCWQEP
jgi:hypothetical protein